MSYTAPKLVSDSEQIGFVEHFYSRPINRELWRFEITKFGKSGVDLYVDHRPELGHIPGWFQGTVITAIAEYAGALSGIASLPAGRMSATVDQHIKFIGQARGEKLIARGHVIKPSLTLIACEADVFVEREGKEHLIAKMIQSNSVFPEAKD